MREAERENIFAEYNQRIGDVVNGTVKRFENGDIIVEIGRIEAVLPRKEQSRAESYAPARPRPRRHQGRQPQRQGTADRRSRGPIRRCSSSCSSRKCPEIYDGTVMIRGAVREAGDRAKVAVFSRERDVDPVGACVGMKGTRVQSIIRELRGEKIDIVEWSEDPIAFVTNALSPAKVQRVSIVDDRERVMEVVVEDKQLSLAIGKKGQNVRLAAKLTGWRIDIKSEEEKRREVEAQFEGAGSAAEDAEGADAARGAEADAAPRRAAEARERRCRTTLEGVGDEDGRGSWSRPAGHAPRRRGRGDRGAAVGDSGHRRQDRREDSGRGASARRPRTRRSPLEQEVTLATVRIYKVAELLGTTSQEVTALLKRDHGIEVKSASSTIEEVVARQFVDRLAQAAEHRAADRRHLRRDARRRRRQEARAGEEGARAAEAGRAGAAAAASGEDREAGRAGDGAGEPPRRRASRRPRVEAPPAEPVY